MEVEKFAKYLVGGIFGVVVVGIIAKDGTQLGAFLNSTSTAFSSFAQGLAKVG